jgi:hypothetical protein
MTSEQQGTAKAEGCPECGSALASDQRYCLNCGWRRGEPRVDYSTQMMMRTQANGAAPVTARPQQQWSPIVAIGAIALLGVFLLLGVLIGKKDNGTTQTVAAQAAPTTTTAAAAPTNTTPTPAANKGKKGKAAAGTAPGQGNVVQGGSGNTAGIQAANEGASALQNAKNGPTQVATPGQAPATDNKPAGGGSGATCIGC